MPVSKSALRRAAVAGQCLLVALCVMWAFYERPAPVVNINWREGISEEARQQAQHDLYLEFVEDEDGGHYELGSPRQADIAAVVAHPDVDDTHRIDRQTATLTKDSYDGTLRVWWAGPFKGVQGHLQFRVVVVLLGVATLLCAAAVQPNPWAHLRRTLLGSTGQSARSRRRPVAHVEVGRSSREGTS